MILKNSKLKIKNRGFTLIEILTSVFVLSIIFGIVSNLFLSFLQVQRRSLALQGIMSETSYVMEYMSRQIRMAKKDIDGTCGFGSKVNFAISTIGTSLCLKFFSYDEKCVTFCGDETNGILNVQIGSDLNPFPLFSTTTVVEKFNINLIGAQQPPGDTNQPRVTIFMKIRGKGEKPEFQPVFQIQTTISQRNLDVAE